MRILAPAACALLLVACATSDLPPVAPVVYACEDGTTLTVRFVQDAAYVSTGNGDEITLPQQRAASGIWYSTPQHELRGKGDDAEWTVGRRVPVKCKVKR